MSGAQTSTFADPNVLLQTLSGAQTAAVQRNQLLNQLGQQEVAANNTEVVARAASTLLDPTLYPTEEARAAAWPGLIQQLKANGYAPNAPEAYPGLDHIKATAQLGISTMDRYKLGLNTSPGTQSILDRVFGTGGNTPQAGGGGPTGSTGAGAGRAATGGDTGGEETFAANNPLNIRYVGQPGAANTRGFAAFKTPEEGLAATDALFGKYADSGINTLSGLISRWAPPSENNTPAYIASVAKATGLDPNAPIDLKNPAVARKIQRAMATVEGNKNSTPIPDAPGGPTASGVVTGDVGRPDLAPPPPGGAPGVYPAMGAGVGAVVGQGVQPNIGGPQLSVAPPPVIRAQPIPAGRTAAADAIQAGIQQAQATPLPGTQVAGPPMVASTQPAAAVAAPSVEAPPEPGWGSQVGTGYGPQNALAPPPPPPAATRPVAAVPAPQPAPAAAAPSVATGVDSPQFQLAQQKLRQAAAIAAMPGYQYNPQLQAAAAFLKEQAAALAQADSVIQTPQGQVHTLTGKIDNPAQPNANYVWSPEQRAYIDTTGTHPPVTPPSPRFSPPTVDPATGKPAVAVEGGQGDTKYLPIPDRPATATFDLQKEQHKRDTDELPKYNEQNQQAAANQIRIQQMRELIDQISTGAGGAERANWANIAEQMGWTDLSKRLIGMGGAAAAQEFAKYGLATAGAQERGDLGARGSLGAITLYKSANPGLELQPDANKKMLTAQLIAAQANRDYTQGAMDYVNRNGDAFVIHGANYTPLSHFDAEWAVQRSPQIYAAAMSAINGDPWQKWTKALNMKDATDVQRVVDIVRRADPTSSIMWKNGEPHDVGTSQ